ncbi:MAG TPA: transcriptional repressor NrdR [candidate division WOR-3 bacterium]|uniref:Transcriptional repressor NrdR n=1 Tax=candidate division WOR-3 bacterium TaxID=2052148 RepID=A0A7V0XEK2_UNCW3|nr:transcriptional repressor NrdR [candidate division WOR-3 bacterium]
MKCPFCEADDDQVLDSRPAQGGTAIRRRRECGGCGRRFTTYESVERTSLAVVKRDGRREPYDRQKLLAGILLALRKRPVSREQVEKMVDGIEATLAEQHRLEISSRELGGLVLARLRALDPVAYVRFASVYRQFDDAEQFVSELTNLMKGGSSADSGGQGPSGLRRSERSPKPAI